MARRSLMEKTRAAFRDRFAAKPRLAAAPGRVNLIGEHTDYNEGFVLPVTIDRYVVVAFAENDAGVLRGYSLGRDDERSLRLEELSPAKASRIWFDYPAAIAWELQRSGAVLLGLDFVVGADLPAGAGLSSSAALMLAVARALAASGSWDAASMARAAHRAENTYVGMPCGIMDPFAVALGDAAHALLIDCQSEALERVPVPEEASIVVMDTGTRRELVGSGYEERRRGCEAAARAVGASSLREASWERIDRAKLDQTSRRRARHVITEIERTLRFAEALQAFDRRAIRELMTGSHASLRDDFEVSTPELDAIVTVALEQPGVIGARMTGAGFGGSAVALVERSEAEAFGRAVESGYREKTGKRGRVFVCRPAPGARLEDGSAAARSRGGRSNDHSSHNQR